MDKERSVDYWANEGGKRIEFVALANGDVRINFNTLDGRTYESLTLASYRYASVVEAIGKFHKGNTMNNKELTELKKIDEIKEEFIKEFVNNHNPDGWRWLRGIYIEDIWNFFLPHLKSNDEIKREAVEGFAHYVVNVGVGTGYILEEDRESALAFLLEGVGNYLTQQGKQ